MIAFRVLVIDDDADDRDFLCTALERVGVESILKLGSAQEVFTYLQGVEKDENLPKLIITDLNMPGITGYEMLQSLRNMKRYQHIPVVICSTSSYTPDIAKCIAAGASQYIRKPDRINDYDHISSTMKRYVLD